MEALDHSTVDEAIVEQQLGRPVRGHWGVARRCHLGVPMAIENHPVLEDGTPFPTLFWLTCPILVKRASRLEATGRMADLSAELSSNGGLRARLASAIERYRHRRSARVPVEDSGGPPGGGPERVKCLHAHLAHELADGPNPIGAVVLAEAGWPDCVRRCVELP